MQQAEGEDFKDMLNTMKAVEFREKRQQKLLQAMFGLWNGQVNNRAKRHYELTLTCKVFKALMLARIQLDSFAQRLQNVYVNLLLHTHFQAIKQFKSINQAQTQQKINQLKDMQKSIRFAQFSNITREIINYKQSKQTNKKEIKQQAQYKTDFQFYKPRLEAEVTTPAKPLLYTQNLPPRPLQDSRRSAQLNLSLNSDVTAKRKFAAVKQLPRMPNLQGVYEYGGIQQNAIDSKSNPQQSIPKAQISREAEPQRQQKAQTSAYSASKGNQKRQANLGVQQEKLPAKKYNKDNILSLICQVKMLQISQINSIIDQYSTSMKCESMINEKGYISLSIATLNSILSL